MTSTNEILSNWAFETPGKGSELKTLDPNYPAWTLTFSDGNHGIAIPLEHDVLIDESFANVRIRSVDNISGLHNSRTLILESPSHERAFAALCNEFVSPGKNGENRSKIISEPLSWWREWKGLLGNKDVESRVYDVLGELLALEYLLDAGYEPIWRGPKSSINDIDCGSSLFEVKSTLSRTSKTITVHGLHQLESDGKKRYIIFCQFEEATQGDTINCVVDRLVDNGLSKTALNNLLSEAGYPPGKSSRDTAFSLIAMTEYVVDDAFPKIEKASFISGDLPVGVVGINYTVSLDGIEGRAIESKTRANAS